MVVKLGIKALAAVLILAASLMAALPVEAAEPFAVATFESLGLYWSPSGGGKDDGCLVRYRRQGDSSWREGLPLWYDASNAGKHGGKYRGSLVHLQPGTTYEIELTLERSGIKAAFTAGTWSERFPVAQTIELPENSSQELVINQSGSSSGYILYTHAPGKSATIDGRNQALANITVNASYVIIRGLTLKGAQAHSVRLQEGAHDVVIEGNDISGWGRVCDGSWPQACYGCTDGFGVDFDAGIYSESRSLKRLTIQRNKIHHPRSDANSWSQSRSCYKDGGEANHPRGPQAIVFFHSAGNHVIRYNEIYSDDNHRFNDILGADDPSSAPYPGFPGWDTDINGNILSYNWDDVIESEGDNRNVRIWGNFFDNMATAVAVAPTDVGPIYIWRNLTRKSFSPSRLLKCGRTSSGANARYIFHNTILQPNGLHEGTNSSAKYVYSRNNILEVSSGSSLRCDSTCDLDYDLYNNSVPSGSERHGIKGTPSYDSGNSSGEYFLSPSSPGHDDGEIIPNFSDGFAGSAPDMGAYEVGRPPLEFGVDAYLIPTPTAPPPTGGPAICFGSNSTIDGDDVLAWATGYLTSTSLPDINADARVNVHEFGYLVSHWGKSCQ